MINKNDKSFYHFSFVIKYETINKKTSEKEKINNTLE